MNPPRITKEHLAALSASLLETEWHVLRDVARFRLIRGDQLTQLHLSNSSPRSARRLLASLVERRLLARLERQVGGRRAGSAGYVYRLGPAGARLLEVSEGRRHWQPSQLFMNHTLEIAERAVRLTTSAGHLQLVRFDPEPDAWRMYQGPAGPQTLKPDGYLVLADDSVEDHWFLEVDMATESLPAIRRKARRYDAYLRSGREQANLGVFPRVWWWTVNERRAAALRSVLDEFDPTGLHVVCTSENALLTTEVD